MIESLTFDPAAKSECRDLHWAGKLPYFQANQEVQFKPGLNVLFGANGSGKSTLLRMLGLSLAAVQGGRSTITQDWLNSAMPYRAEAIGFPWRIKHDGQPALFCDARDAVGLIGGGAAFDDDFFSEGVAAGMLRASAGQTTMSRLNRALGALTAAKEGKPDSFPTEVQWKVSRTHMAKAARDQLDAWLAPSCAAGPHTILLDEPESGFSLAWQSGLWRNILSKVDPEKFQVIVATHSPFALGIEGAHYIDLTPAYRTESEFALLRDMVAKHPGWFIPEVQALVEEMATEVKAHRAEASPPPPAKKKPARRKKAAES